jgi:putative ATPase
MPHMPSADDDLFSAAGEARAAKESPLAARMRPRTLDEFIGQEHIIGPGRLLRRAIQADQLSSIILFGPPGTGKTTLARIIANTTRARFLAINAVLAGVKDIRESIESARAERKSSGRKTLLFVDEVHRFNKAQQDALLPHVENGTLTLIGATTENPYFEVNKALVSRSRIFQLKPLGEEHVREVVKAALADPERGYGRLRVEMDAEALDHLVRVASGDARSALNALELAVETTSPDADGAVRIGLEVAEESIQRRAVLYDKDGDAHYDTISAFIKSVRGSDPDAALYWMSKMVYAGEDPRFIFRRMLILASEDVGLADPAALGVVASAAQAFDYVGLPEGQFHLAQACLYLATAPKTNTTLAYFDALESVRREQQDEVPDHLKDASRDSEDLGHGKGYLYPHAYREHWVAQQYLPKGLQGKVFYQPADSGYEADIRDRVARNREAQLEAADQARLGIGEGPSTDETGWGSAARPRSGKPPGYSAWLERAAGRSGEVLGKVREEIFRLAGTRRDSLVLDLFGGTGFLTWEACRRCPVGGVWTRCDDDAARKAMEDWARHLEMLARPVLVTSDLDALPRALSAAADASGRGATPRFDALIGVDLLRRLQDARAFMQAIASFTAPGARLVWAEANPRDSQGFLELFPEGSLERSLRAKVEDAESAWRGSLPESPLKSLLDIQVRGSAVEAGSRQLEAAAEVRIVRREIRVRKQFTPSRIREWLAPDAAGKDTLLGRLAASLSLREKSALEAALTEVFARGGIDWRQGYDFLVAEFAGAAG